MLVRHVQNVQHRAENGQSERGAAKDGRASIESPCALVVEEAAPEDEGGSEEYECGCVADMCACVGDVFDRLVGM